MSFIRNKTEQRISDEFANFLIKFSLTHLYSCFQGSNRLQTLSRLNNICATRNYASNSLNQYSAISKGSETPFHPEYDAAGNQTLIKTSTGLWSVAYNANSRPVKFTSQDEQKLVECNYDYMGRRFLKKSTINGELNQQHHYLYRGYLQIAALDMKTAQVPALRYIHWDPTAPIATRSLSIRKRKEPNTPNIEE